jgi:hypothetical protein
MNGPLGGAKPSWNRYVSLLTILILPHMTGVGWQSWLAY